MDTDHSDLSLEDVEFLQAVQAINETPDEFENTGEGETPATTSAIRVGSRLDRQQVKYRSRPSETLEDFVVVHEAEFDPDSRTFGPTSVELTEAGRTVLDEYEDEQGATTPSATASSGAYDELEERIERLENIEVDGEIDAASLSAQIESLQESIEGVEGELKQINERVTAIESAELGALDEDMAANLESVFTKVPVMMYLFDVLFDTDVEYLEEQGTYDEDELERSRQRAFETVASAAGVEVPTVAADGAATDGAGAADDSGGQGDTTAGDEPRSEVDSTEDRDEESDLDPPSVADDSDSE